MIPAELLARPNWLAWEYRTRGGKSTKVPLSVHGGLGKSNDPATQGTYREALAVLGADGVGFAFSPEDPYCGVDIDGCLSTNGAIHPEAYRIVHKLAGYVEFSPSGYGLHVIVRGRLARNRSTTATPWRAELAFFDHGKFFTMSGDGRGEIRDSQEALMELVAYYFPEPAETPRPTPRKPLCDDDAAVLDRIHADGRMAALYAGDTSGHADDHSAADLALCDHLAFLTGNDPARIDSLFRASGLMRDKWDSPRGDSTYGRQTIDKALKRA